MIIDGRLMSIKGDKAVIQQFWTFYKFEVLKKDLEFEVKNGDRVMIEGYYSVRITGYPETYAKLLSLS